MGLSIHYNGRIKDPDLLPELIEEVKDICEDFKWEYFILDEELPKDNYGKGFIIQKKCMAFVLRHRNVKRFLCVFFQMAE